MTLEEMAVLYESEITTLKSEYESLSPIVCDHIVCEECRNTSDRNSARRNELSVLINEKTSTLKNLMKIQ